MSAGLRYAELIADKIERIRVREFAKIRLAADRIAASLQAGGIWHVFGTGHSHMLAEELFYRAGGLAAVNPILEESLMLHAGAAASARMERLQGLAAIVLDRHSPRPGDVLLIVSHSGRNTVVVEMAEQARLRGMTVIALTSLQQAEASASRHPEGRHLRELSDIVLDNLGCVGDAAVDVEGLDVRAAPTSTVIGAFIVNALAAEVAERLAGSGAVPDVYSSNNTGEGEARNSSLIRKYKGVIRCL
jgi:uncharacterized phosphosugar-binding protein